MVLHTSNPAPPASTLRILFWLRNSALVVQVAAFIFVEFGASVDIPALPVISLLGVMAASNVLMWLLWHNGHESGEPGIFGLIVFDVLILSALLYFTGGSTNPFTALYLLPLSVAAMMVSMRLTWIVFALAATCYGLLLFYHVPLTSTSDSHDVMMNLHVGGMWFTFLISASLIAYFVAGIRARDAVIATGREAAMRNEQILAIGTLAAGAAHELSTPLSTIAVLTRELQEQYAGNRALVDDLSLLRRQVETCKNSITALLTAAGQQRLEDATAVPATQFVKDVLAKWQLIRPLAHLDNTLVCDEPEPWIITDATLSQALINILNNAADASPDNVEINTHWNSREVTIEVRDCGAGLQGDATTQAGQAFFSTKAPDSGRGLGLFLARAAIERLGGSLRMQNRDGGGLCIQISLPITRQTP